VARLHVAAELTAAEVGALAAGVLRPVDVVALYAPGEYELLLPGLDGEAARTAGAGAGAGAVRRAGAGGGWPRTRATARHAARSSPARALR
jgi:hypothetical protein